MGIQRALSRFEENELGRVSTAQTRRTASVQSQDVAQDRLIASLSTFSTKLAEDRIAESKERIKKEVAEAKALAIEQDFELIENEGIDPIPQADRESFENDKFVLQHNHAATKEATRVALDNGATFDDSQKIASLSGWALYAYTSQKAEIAGSNYKAWLEGEMTRDSETMVNLDGQSFPVNQAKTLRQKQAAMKVLRQKFLIDNDLINVRRELLAQENGFYDKAKTAHSDVMSAYIKQDSIERSFEIKQKAIKAFKSSKNYNDLYTSLLTTVDENNKPLSREKALDEVHEIIKEEMLNDDFQEADLERLGEQEILDPNTGLPIKIKDKWPNRFKKLEREMVEADKKNNEIAEQKKENRFKEDEATVIDAIGELARTDPDKIDNKYLETKAAELAAQHPGFKSDKLENYIKFGAPDAKTLAIQEGEIKDLISKGLLTPARLAQFDVRHQVTYRQQAELIGKVNSREQQKHVDAMKDLVEFNAGVTAMESKHPSVGLMVDFMQNKYRQELAKAIEADDPNPSETAYTIASTWFNDRLDTLMPVQEEGYVVPNTPKPAEIKKNEKAIHNENKRQHNLIKKHGKKIFLPDNINKLITQKELTEALERYNENGPLGYQYPGEINRLFRHYGNPRKGIGKFEIMNQVLEASGLPALGEKPPSIEKIDANTTKADQVSLDTGNPWTSSRVLASVAARSQTPNVELVPNGQGEAIFQVAEQSGLPFGESAAAYEFLVTNPTIGKKLGVTPAEDGSVDWDRFGLAIMILGSNLKDDAIDTFESIPGITPDPETDIGKQSGEALINMFESIPGITPDPETDLGKQVGDKIVDTAVDVRDSVVEGFTNLQQIITESINEFSESIILTEEQKNELAVSAWKYSGDPMDLNKTLRQ
jgi:hypothetical protein